MTFQGKEIVRPTLALIKIFIAKKGYEIDAMETLEYWEKKKWLTNKGKDVKTLEAAVTSYNGVVLGRLRKDGKQERTRTNCRWNNQRKKKAVAEKPKNKELPYESQLKDKRWKAFRQFVFAVRGNRCEMCGDSQNLQIHHPRYKPHAMAWEYTCNEVVVLCGHCHMAVHGIVKDN